MSDNGENQVIDLAERRAQEGEHVPPKLRAVRATNVEIRPVRWFWPGRIPLGKVTVMDGSPGLAKSTIATDLAARATAGLSMPDGKPGVKGSAVYVGMEDDLGDTLVPRFLAAGGEAEHFILADTVDTEDGPRPLEIPEDVPHLEALVNEVGAVLVVIDPLMAALGIDVKTGIDHHVRRALSPLREMAERTEAAVLLIRHLNKAVNISDPVMRGGGIIGAARAGLIVAQDPDDLDRRILAVSKMNVGRDDAPSLAYQVKSDAEHEVGVIDWLGTSDRTAQDLLQTDAPTARGARGEAVGVLRELLAEGPVLATEAKVYCKEAGVSPSTLDRAKTKLGVIARPKTDEDGKRRWWWSLPAAKDDER